MHFEAFAQRAKAIRKKLQRNEKEEHDIRGKDFHAQAFPVFIRVVFIK